MKINVEKSPLKLSVLLLLNLFIGNFAFGQIVINEYSCSNLKITRENIYEKSISEFSDNFEKFEDWIEIYNPSDEPFDIAGYYLSDKIDKPTKWQIPDVDEAIIPSKGFLLVWASGRDTVVGTNFHSNFMLKQTKTPGEHILLSDKSGAVIESHALSKTQLGHSVGRDTNSSVDWGVFVNPTPGNSNNGILSYQYGNKPVFSLDPGFYDETISISISANMKSGDTIRYTLDGTKPTLTSQAYLAPLSISKTTVVKAIVFSNSNNTLPGQLEYGTYFINEDHNLDVVSVSADSLTDLVVNNSEFVRPHGSFEYYGKDKQLKSKSLGEYNKHGQDSWVCPQRSLDFIARDEMGDNHSIQEKIFPDYERDEYQRLILRASGDDNYPCGHLEDNEGSTHMRDGYIHNLALRSDLHLDVRASKRVIVYVNGEYWGVYEVRDNPDDHDFTKEHYKQDKYNLQYLLTWGDTWSKYGGDKAYSDWSELYDFIMNNDMSIEANYDSVKSQYNVKSLVDYVLVNSFTVCSDWLNYNVGWWRGLNPNGKHKKWGYILWDNDATFNFYINYTGIPDVSATAKPCNPEELTDPISDPEGHITILNKLKTNPEFKNYYINRHTDLLNTTFSCDSMLSYFDEYTDIIAPEMTRHSMRWDGTYAGWQANVNILRNYISERCMALQQGMNSCYNLSGPYSLTMDTDPSDKASFKVNSLKIDDIPWTGIAYEGIETILKVKPIDEETDIFYGWSSELQNLFDEGTKEEISIQITGTDSVTAHFTPLINSVSNIEPGEFSASLYPTITQGEIFINYSLASPDRIYFELFDFTGNKVSDLGSKGSMSSMGEQIVSFNLASFNLPRGTYFVKVSAGSNLHTLRTIYLHD